MSNINKTFGDISTSMQDALQQDWDRTYDTDDLIEDSDTFRSAMEELDRWRDWTDEKNKEFQQIEEDMEDDINVDEWDSIKDGVNNFSDRIDEREDDLQEAMDEATEGWQEDFEDSLDWYFDDDDDEISMNLD